MASLPFFFFNWISFENLFLKSFSKNCLAFFFNEGSFMQFARWSYFVNHLTEYYSFFNHSFLYAFSSNGKQSQIWNGVHFKNNWFSVCMLIHKWDSLKFLLNFISPPSLSLRYFLILKSQYNICPEHCFYPAIREGFYKSQLFPFLTPCSSLV